MIVVDGVEQAIERAGEMIRKDLLQVLKDRTYAGVCKPLRPVCRAVSGNPAVSEWHEVSWHEHLSPVVDEQDKPSCVGWGMANVIEIMTHMQTGGRIRLDGRAIWEKGRELFYGGDQSGGLALFHGVRAAVLLGMVPANTSYSTIPLEVGALVHALEHGPLLCANTAHPGWSDLHSSNDAVDESRSFTPGTNGHCTCMYALDTHNGVRMFRMENSWGGRGQVAMTVEHFIATALYEPLQIRADFRKEDLAVRGCAAV